jgi:hypothetical protein
LYDAISCKPSCFVMPATFPRLKYPNLLRPNMRSG